MGDKRPWVEKYRPKKLGDVVGHADIVVAFRRMLETGDLTHLLLYGPPGTGKTSTVLALCAGCEMLELNASDDRGIETVRTQVKEFVSTQKLTTFFQKKSSSSGPKSCLKLVVLDECDALTLPAQMALRRIIEQFSTGARFCLIANHINKLIPAILSRCTRFRFSPLPSSAIAERLQNVATQENVIIQKEAIDAIVETAGGDLRKAINTLQSLSTYNGKTHNVGKPSIDGKTGTEGKPCIDGKTGNDGNPGVDEKSDEWGSAASVYGAAGRCLPEDLAKLFVILRSESYAPAYAAASKLVTRDGFSVADLVRGIHPLVVTSVTEPKSFSNIIIDLGDIERRLATGASELIQLAALVASFQINR